AYSAASFAQASERNATSVSIDLPPGQLAETLIDLGDALGVNIIAPESLVAGKTSPAIRGRLTPEDALALALSSSGLIVKQTPQGDYTISRRAEGRGSRTDSRSERARNEGGAPLDLETITISGELLERTLQDTRTSVAVITGEELERRADPDIFSVFERTAGVSLGSGGETIVIRGISAGGFGGGAPVITTRIDGAVASFTRFSNNALESTWDLEQVEVLLGPQSTQSGRNTLAGAVEIRSKDPTYEREFKARGEVGNSGLFGGAVAANLPLVDGVAAVRVSLDHDQSDGFVDNLTLGSDDYDRADQTTFRAGLRLDPSENLSAVFKYTRMDGESSGNGPTLQRSLFPGSRVSLANVEDREDVRGFDAGNLRLVYDINESWRLESETTYSEANTLTTLDVDQTPLDGGVFVNDQTTSTFEQEIKIGYRSDWIKAVFGAFYAADDVSSPQGSTVPAFLLNPAIPPGVSLTVASAPRQESSNYAAFGEAEFRIRPKLAIVAGGRYDSQDVENSNVADLLVSDPAFAPFLPPSSTTFTDTDFDAFLPKVGLIYDFTDDVGLGFTAQRGYRAGGVEINRGTGQSNSFDPEFTWNYEVALRSRWGDRWTVNANAFYTDWDDQQVAVDLLTINQRTANAGSSRLFGGELDVKWLATINLDVFLSLGFADTKFRDFGEDSGNEFPFAAKYTGAIGGTYSITEDLYVSADASFQSSAFSDAANTETSKIDGRFLTNVRLGYDADRWSVIAYANNLFDDDYVTAAVPSLLVPGQSNVIAGLPRVYGVIGQIRF
ncbi:MAG: TonB-dependent receptor, partial [Pseudomonadota bacterium]